MAPPVAGNENTTLGILHDFALRSVQSPHGLNGSSPLDSPLRVLVNPAAPPNRARGPSLCVRGHYAVPRVVRSRSVLLLAAREKLLSALKHVFIRAREIDQEVLLTHLPQDHRTNRSLQTRGTLTLEA